MNTLAYVQLAIAVLLITTILLQQRGTGMSSLMGGSALEYSTKRGAEKVIFYATVVLAIAFIGTAIAGLIISR